MSALRKALSVALAGVVLLVVIVVAQRHFLNAAEERGRKSGAAIQHATDQLATDSALAVVARATQARLDSAVRVVAAHFAATDTVYRTARAQIVERYHTDTLIQRFVMQSDSTIGACKGNVLSCELARQNAEQDAARTHLKLSERDATIVEMAHADAPPPRSCTVPAIVGGLAGLGLGSLLHH